MDLTIFMILLISSFEIINVVVRKAKSARRKAQSKGRRLYPNIFLWTTASVADAAVNPNGIKIL